MTIKRNLFRDILRDQNSKKFSMTKVAALSTLIIFISASVTALTIMITEKEIDYIFIGEVIALLLTLLGFKNFKGNFKHISVEKQEESVIVTSTTTPESDTLENEDKDEIG